jgi:hypothetical protein
MHPKFEQLVTGLHVSCERLLACAPHSGLELLPMNVPKRAVYLFSEGDSHLYVGRTNRLRARRSEHLKGRANDAPFAFKLARHETGHIGKSGLKRRELELDPEFAEAFVAAKKRVAAMQFRWIEETDPNRQCLLEIYVSVVLEARYNDFENH